MKKLSLVLSLAIAATVTAAGLGDANKDTTTLNQIAGYRQWTRVNPDPVEVPVPATRRAGGLFSIASETPT